MLCTVPISIWNHMLTDLMVIRTMKSACLLLDSYGNGIDLK
jgi:hypothetical protein